MGRTNALRAPKLVAVRLRPFPEACVWFGRASVPRVAKDACQDSGDRLIFPGASLRLVGSSRAKSGMLPVKRGATLVLN